MKIRILLILFVFSFTLIYAQKADEHEIFEKINHKQIECVFDEYGRKVDKETNALRINRNEYYKSDSKEADEIALSYLNDNRDIYGLSNNPNEIKITQIAETPAGKYVYFQQYLNDIQVFATNFIVYVNKENTVTYTLNEFRNIAKYKNIQSIPSIHEKNALMIANNFLNINNEYVIGEPKTDLVYFECIDRGLELSWKININSMEPMGDWQIFVSAIDGLTNSCRRY
jgi:Zn-dependent metalloprotease